MKRHALPFVFALAATVLLSACGGEAASPPAAAAAVGSRGVLNVYNWPDYIAEDTIHDFEAKTGIKVNYSIYSNNDALMEQLAAPPDAYDLIFPSSRPYAQQLIARDGLVALDKAKLGNLRHIDPAILRELAAIDTNNSHIVPYMWGTTGIGINVPMVRKALGTDADLDTWGLLFDPEKAKKLSGCGIAIMDNELEALSAALIWKGRDPADFSQEATLAARDAHDRVRQYVRKYAHDSELIEGLADGTFCVVLSYSGDVQQAKARAEERAEANGSPAAEIRYLIPREGAMRWTDVIGIPKGAKNVDNAHRFLQYLMEPQVIAKISDHVAYANGNLSATPLMDKAVSQDPGIYPPANVRAKLRTILDSTEAQTNERKSAWMSILYGHM